MYPNPAHAAHRSCPETRWTRGVELRPLEPAPINALARELMVKARRRKGHVRGRQHQQVLRRPHAARAGAAGR